MNLYGGFGVGALLIAACGVVDATRVETSEQGTAQAGNGGAGGSTASDCVDRWSTGGAVHIAPVAPPAGSWCPHEGFELCTDPASGLYPDPDPVDTADAGRDDPPVVLSRCVDQHWQTVAGASCEPTTPSQPPWLECNVFSYQFSDGACCVDVRNCERAFCDGARWWTRR
jgi:hypothetical protein